jgi:long-chain fatty acid transport protein
MRKSFCLLIAAVLITGTTYAGGIVTNTNQSASYIRMPARDASLGIDAVYYNPAGLTSLTDGLHLSLNNQSIFQNRSIANNFPFLNESEFKGTATAPLFPGIYAAYKTGNLAFSFGFNPVGGGGVAVYESGLPSFEMAPSMLVPGLASMGVTEYRLNTSFEGSSVFLGYQGGMSYKINQMISVFAGVRYVAANNVNQGYLQDIEVFNFGGSQQWTRADLIMGGIAGSATTGATQLQGAIDLGLLAAGDPISQEMAATLTSLGVNPTGFTNENAVLALHAAAAGFNQRAELLGNQEADVQQSGSGITPVFGVNLTFDKLNIGIKYEMATSLELQNKTTKDVTVAFHPVTGERITMFPDGRISRNDMPAKLSLGAAYQATSKLNVAAGMHYFFDKSADYGRSLNGLPVKNEDVIDNNFIELALGLEYGLTDNLLVSAGYLLTQSGVSQNYHNDLNHSLSSNNFGLGGRYAINEMLAVNLGFLMSFYGEDSRSFTHSSFPVTETYNRDNMVFAIGLDFKF